MGLFSRSPATQFPDVEGARLDGTAVAFPADLPADATLLIVSFRDDLDPVADQWARLAERLSQTYGDRVQALETPVVGRRLRMLGELGTVGIRREVGDEAERLRTVPLYVDKKAFCKALALRSTQRVTAFLVDRAGAIAWQGEGEIDMDELSALEAAVQSVLAAADRPAPPSEAGTDAEAGADALDPAPESA